MFESQKLNIYNLIQNDFDLKECIKDENLSFILD